MIPERFVLHITGTVSRVRTRHLIVPNSLPHLFAQFLAGGVISPETWAAYGLRVEVEVDTDDGEP